MWSLVIPFLLGSLTAIFAEPIRRHLFKPKLKLEFHNDGNYSALTPEGSPTTPIEAMKKAYYVRIKVSNLSRIEAKNCRAYLINIEKVFEQKKFEQTIYCDPIPLAWSCQNPGEQYSGVNLNKGTIQFADVVTTREGKSFFDPQIKLKPFRYVPIFQQRGKFRFTIQVTASNADPETIKLIFEWNGKWNEFKAYKN